MYSSISMFAPIQRSSTGYNQTVNEDYGRTVHEAIRTVTRRKNGGNRDFKTSTVEFNVYLPVFEGAPFSTTEMFFFNKAIEKNHFEEQLGWLDKSFHALILFTALSTNSSRQTFRIR